MSWTTASTPQSSYLIFMQCSLVSSISTPKPGGRTNLSSPAPDPEAACERGVLKPKVPFCIHRIGIAQRRREMTGGGITQEREWHGVEADADPCSFANGGNLFGLELNRRRESH